MAGGQRSGGRLVAASALLVLVLASACAVELPRSGETHAAPALRQRPFAAASPFNRPIGQAPEVDAQSDQMIADLFSKAPGAPIANLDEYGFGIYEAAPGTPRRTVRCKKPWGDCPFENETVPVTEDMEPPPGGDAQIAVIDRSTGHVYEMWQYRWNHGDPVASWGAVVQLGGSGATDPPDGTGHSRGSGLAVLAGVVRRYEIEQGRIDHALEFSTNRCKSGEFRAPAVRTDGQSDDDTAIPEGTRIQLDPSLDLNSIPNLSAAERTIARALQRYGAYAVDCGGSPMAIGFERVPPGGSNPYSAAGLNSDYMAMTHIPVDRLRVLAAWNTGSAP